MDQTCLALRSRREGGDGTSSDVTSPPDDAQTIERVVTALGDQPRSTTLLVAGDFNMDLGETASDGRGTDIAAALTEAGVEDMTAHFLPRKRLWGRELRTWSMVREGRVIRYQTDYLLRTDRSLFRNVAVRDPRHNSDHYMVMGHLRSETAQEHAQYIRWWRKMPLQPPKEPTREDELFGDLRQVVPKPHERYKHRNAWISEETWIIADERALAKRGMRVRARLRRLGQA